MQVTDTCSTAISSGGTRGWSADRRRRSIPQRAQEAQRPSPRGSRRSIPAGVHGGGAERKRRRRARPPRPSTAAGRVGLPAHSGGNAPNQNYPDTWVYYRPGQPRRSRATWRTSWAAATTAAAMPASITNRSGRRTGGGRDRQAASRGKLAVTARRRSRRASRPARRRRSPRRRSTGPTSTTPSTSLHFPILYPTVAQPSSDVVPVGAEAGRAPARARLPGHVHIADPHLQHRRPPARAGTRCMRCSSGRAGDGPYWGIEETRYTDAPILQTPNATRTPRRPQVPVLLQRQPTSRRSRFIQNGVAYWVQNTPARRPHRRRR